MPVATGGAMKGISHHDLHALGAEILLCNTYHLHLQPGEEVVEEAGGLHRFIGWDKPILTDSGGFQVFSMRRINEVSDIGVRFQSHLNGDTHFLGPDEAMQIQHALGSDIIMVLDQCPPSKAPRDEQVKAVDRTLRWAEECKNIHQVLCEKNVAKVAKVAKVCNGNLSLVPLAPLLFGIIQGGLERDLREKCAQELIAMNFDGYAIGGLAVGESEEEMLQVLDVVCPLLPKDKPRYLMGVGKIEQIRTAVAKGIDMFDSVLPMREGRHGTLKLSDGSTIRIEQHQFKHDHSTIDADSPSPLSRVHSKSYLHYLFQAKERFSETIGAMQNIGVTLREMKRLRGEIEAVT